MTEVRVNSDEFTSWINVKNSAKNNAYFGNALARIYVGIHASVCPRYID